MTALLLNAISAVAHPATEAAQQHGDMCQDTHVGSDASARRTCIQTGCQTLPTSHITLTASLGQYITVHRPDLVMCSPSAQVFAASSASEPKKSPQQDLVWSCLVLGRAAESWSACLGWLIGVRLRHRCRRKQLSRQDSKARLHAGPCADRCCGGPQVVEHCALAPVEQVEPAGKSPLSSCAPHQARAAWARPALPCAKADGRTSPAAAAWIKGTWTVLWLQGLLLPCTAEVLGRSSVGE